VKLNVGEEMVKKVYVGNLPFKLRGKDLRELFGKVGEVEFATVILDRNRRSRSKGFGFVTFINDLDAEKAIAEMNGKEVDGRSIVVKEAQPRERDGPEKENSEEETSTK
jgi:RNA recognition motif-containing protein